MSREPTDTNGSGTPPADGEWLSAWLDGEIDPAEAAELEAELARDPALKAELDSLETVVRLLRDEGPSQAPLGFHHRVMARVEEEHPVRPSWWAWFRRPLGVPLEGWAIGLAAAVALLLVLPSKTPPAEVPVPEETSPAVVKLPEPEAPPVASKEPVPTPAAAPELKPTTRKGADRVVKGKPTSPPAPEVIPGKVTTGEDQPGAVATVVLPPPTEAPVGIAGTADGESSLYRMVVRSEDVAVKRAVLTTCSRYGTPVGTPVATMASSSEKVVCGVSAGKLPEFAKSLASTGYAVESALPDGLVAGNDFVRVEITIQLVGGAIQAAPPGAVNAARQKALQEDEIIAE